jgi:hypothetical protein
MTYDPVYTVYKNPNIIFTKNGTNDYRLVKCVGAPIKSGTILLIEQTFMDTPDCFFMKRMIRYNRTLYDSLYPRVNPWTETLLNSEIMSQDLDELLTAKINFNSFADNSGNLIIGKMISSFNHSRVPNAKILRLGVTLPKVENGVALQKAVFSSVIALKTISIGEEIFIKYNDKVIFADGDQRVFQPDTLKDEQSISNTILNYLRAYAETDKFAEICTVQYAVKRGLYLPEGLVIPTRVFSKYIQETYKRGFDEKLIKSWLSSLHGKFANVAIN